MSGECEKCGEHTLECGCMRWINVKDKLPPDGEVILIKLKYSQPFICVARFLDNLSTLEGDYNNIFIMIVHPRFPKLWLFDEQYRKISRIPKNKVEFWMPIPEIPK